MPVTYTYIIRSHNTLLQHHRNVSSNTTTTTTAFSATYFNKSSQMRDLPACSALPQPMCLTPYPAHAR